MKDISELTEALEHTLKTVPETELADVVLDVLKTHLDISDHKMFAAPCHTFKVFAFQPVRRAAKRLVPILAKSVHCGGRK